MTWRARPAGTPPVRDDGPLPWCRAPLGHLYLHPTGEVRACCQSQQALGNVGSQGLLDIWRGAVRARTVELVGEGRLPEGCRSCAAEADLEGRRSSYAATFDDLAPAASGDWPTSMELNLSNACNLQCIQCNAELSSSIRAHQTDLPPLPKVYGDAFFEDLLSFLPHLERLQFAGGEPFLASENYRVWDLVASHAPHVRCSVVTNATIWSSRVEAALEAVPMDLVLSIDAVDAPTYESIRRGARWDEVRANIDRFASYRDKRGTNLTINHCLMAQNARGFGDLLLFAEERGIGVEVSVVRGPAACTLTRLPAEDLQAIARDLRDRSDDISARLDRNLAVWERELDRISAWADATEADRVRAYGDTRYGTGFAYLSEGVDRDDRAEVLASLAAFADEGSVHQLSVRREVVDWCTPGLEGELGLAPGTMRGQAPDAFVAHAVAAFGPRLVEPEVGLVEGRQTVTVRHARGEIRVVPVPEDDGATILCVGVRRKSD